MRKKNVKNINVEKTFYRIVTINIFLKNGLRIFIVLVLSIFYWNNLKNIWKIFSKYIRINYLTHQNYKNERTEMKYLNNIQKIEF